MKAMKAVNTATTRLALDQARLAALGQRWGVTELALFGSVLRADFRPNSDVRGCPRDLRSKR